ncbi:MAG: photosynthetic reaction center subunit L [Cyanobacteria bacterium CAN_BIN43]|nr:photosynthetic reaction center subunit L [Cyanobacteria bacterium CAN_BIN43]
MLSYEADYRREAMGVPARASFGLFKTWIGRFYLGLWGIVGVLTGTIGSAVWLWQVVILDPTQTGNPLRNFVAGQIPVPKASLGMGIATTGADGLWWQVVVFCATITFLAWMLRQVDISRQLKMRYHVPVAYAAVLSSWVTIQIVRPALLGHWAEGFPLGVLAHLDWLSAFGYRYYNFYYNPFHALGVALLFGSGFVLSLHGATILSASGLRNKGVTEDNINRFYWDFFGYSVGEIGVHRLAFLFSVLCVLLSNLCLVLSGTVVQDWSRFWDFWNKLPIWSGFGF